jgi:hypothetical protein
MDYQPGTVENFSGGPAGVFNPYNSVLTSPYGANGTGPNNIFFLTQSWAENISTLSGSVLVLRNTQDEFYNGEFSGSVLTVTTQSLAQSYPLQNESFSYKQVYYYGTGSGEENTFENLFLNNVTSPQNGEILFMEKGNILFGSWSSLYSPKYLKIAKIDCSGSNNTIALGQLDTILINTPVSGLNAWLQYDVTVLNEFSNYYLYQVVTVKYLNQPVAYIPSAYPNQVLDYTISASSAATIAPVLIPLTLTSYSSVSGNTLGYFNSTTGIHTLGNTPNTLLSITGSVSVGGIGGTGTFNLNLLRQGNTTVLATTNVSTGNSYSISSSYYGLQGDQIYLNGSLSGGIISYFSGSLLLTQSRAISSSNCELVIFEPYITEPNYYYSNFNPVMNNVDEARLNTIYQDIDYSSNILTPVNFNLLISGSALKAAVQDSNYSSKRVTLPRYDGVKSTSQQLNVWTPGDTGTYGKLPTIENLKTMVAYCDSISGWPPERMNASAIHILYLIKSDGTVVIPNTSENSLYDNKGTFESGEKLIISPKTVAAGDPQQYRNVIRGGTRIEPILYTQYGSTNVAPSASWINTINFANLFDTGIPTITTDVRAQYNYINNATLTNNAPTIVPFDIIISGQTQSTPGRYTVAPNVINEAISLQIVTKTIIKLLNNSSGSPYNFLVQLLKYSPSTSTTTILNFNNNVTVFNIGSITLSANLNSTMLAAGDEIYVNVFSPNVSPSHLPIELSNSDGSPNQSEFIVNQSPIPITSVTSSGVNSLWGWPNPTLYPNVITCSNNILNEAFNNFNIKQSDITGSGFNPVTLPWSIEYGDEFRFEGREDLLYQVGKIFSLLIVDQAVFSKQDQLKYILIKSPSKCVFFSF